MEFAWIMPYNSWIHWTLSMNALHCIWDQMGLELIPVALDRPPIYHRANVSRQTHHYNMQFKISTWVPIGLCEETGASGVNPWRHSENRKIPHWKDLDGFKPKTFLQWGYSANHRWLVYTSLSELWCSCGIGTPAAVLPAVHLLKM